ncbi:hypothetical protein K8F61_05230 [Microbacterium resistens]|uniref:DUF4177 domain-containing protein n=1 Tax=Microbacterium resistens TaxID=156977 RepID=A0ABY3RYI9_9MICO|nr:hypothetical protein [Microbacterium resistens]UGS27592.1 hypothetical protein K8F61_05230 [Microbacterium resistens]
MDRPETYEFAEVIVGFLNDDDGMATFMQVRSITGDETTADFGHGPLEALNLMGAQGWQLHSEREATEGRIMWVWSALRRSSKNPPYQWQAREFLMSRPVRD